MSSPNYNKHSEDSATEFPPDWYVLSNEKHFWMQWRLKALYNLLATLNMSLERKQLALDIGCGTGTFANQIEQVTNWVVDGFDLHPHPIEDLWKGKGSFSRFNIFDTEPDQFEKYDVVFLMDVLEHLDSPASFLAQSVKFLKPGGKVVINVPAFQFLFSKYDVVVGHKRRYNKTTFNSVLVNSGINVNEMRYWGFSTFFILMLRKIFLMPIQNEKDIIKRGFEPPTDFANLLLRSLMKIENFAIQKPVIGSSLLIVGEKEV